MVTIQDIHLTNINRKSNGKVGAKFNIRRLHLNRTTQIFQTVITVTPVMASMTKDRLRIATINMTSDIEATTAREGHQCSRMDPPNPTTIGIRLEVKDLKIPRRSIDRSVSVLPPCPTQLVRLTLQSTRKNIA